MMNAGGVAYQIEKIRQCFLRAQQISLSETDRPRLINYLENTDPEFRSVAYEGASMEIALKDLNRNSTLSEWHSFLKEESCADHATQIHVGLGWALAQEQHPPSACLKLLHPLLAHRVLDGFGYYDGIFRSRSSVVGRHRSKQVPENFFQAYDMGIGRSLWYRCKGEPLKITDLIDGFSVERHSDLWLGVGIACTYVGGFTPILLNELAACAGSHQSQLASGAALAARARIQAKSTTPFAEMACQQWCNRSALDAMQLTLQAELSSEQNSAHPFKAWIAQIKSAVE